VPARRPARKVLAILSGESAKKVAVGVAIFLIGASFEGIGRVVGRTFARHPTHLANIAPYLPAEYRVTRRLDVDMDNSGTPEAIVVAVGVPGKTEIAPTKVIIVSWDSEANRWTTVFDSSKRSRGFRDQPFISTEVRVINIQILTIRGRPGRQDLAIAATLTTGVGGSWEAIAILTYDQDVVDFGYEYQGTATGVISVVGPADSQQLEVTASFHTPLSAHCCPVRDYSFNVGYADDDQFSSSYHEFSDDRPWLGTYALTDDLPGVKIAQVAEVGADSPLRPGDLVVEVGKVRFSPKREQPQLIDDLAVHIPSDTVNVKVRRGTSVLSFDVPLISRLTEFLTRGDDLAVPEIDGKLSSAHGPSSPSNGVVVGSVSPKGIAARAGIESGDIITACDGNAVGRVADLNYEFLGARHAAVTLTVTHRGLRRKVRIRPRFVYPVLPGLEPELSYLQPLEIF
jgi:hypothetical protein